MNKPCASVYKTMRTSPVKNLKHKKSSLQKESDNSDKDFALNNHEKERQLKKKKRTQKKHWENKNVQKENYV